MNEGLWSELGKLNMSGIFETLVLLVLMSEIREYIRILIVCRRGNFQAAWHCLLYNFYLSARMEAAWDS